MDPPGYQDRLEHVEFRYFLPIFTNGDKVAGGRPEMPLQI